MVGCTTDRIRRIVHVDMDAFYASIHQRDEPGLRGKPVVVGGSPQSRGVVAAASYEARRFGVRSAMPCARVPRLCPQAVYVRPDFPRYKAVSRQIHAIFHEVTDQVEPLALDEAYLDVTDNALGEPSGTRVAEYLRRRIRETVGLTASAGVAANKLVAKIASDANKPDGICVVPPDRAADFLAPLPVRRLPGIGPKTEQRCLAAGIERILDLRTADEATLGGLFGRHAERMRLRSWGEDDSPVRSSRQRKSIGIEDTFAADLTTRAAAVAELERLVTGLEDRRSRSRVLGGRTVTLKVKYADFSLITRSRTFAHALDDPAEILGATLELLDQTEVGERPVRLLGISLSHLIEDDGQLARQLDFFTSLQQEAGPDPTAS